MRDKIQHEKTLKHSLLNKLIRMHGKDILRIAQIYMKSREAAEDVFQEVFYRVYKNLDSYSDIREVKGWLVRITINVCKDMLRCPWNNKYFLLKEDDESLDNIIDYDFINKTQLLETNEIVWSIFKKMPKIYKDILILYCINGFSYKEISKILNIPTGTVKTRLRRARLDFRRQYEKLAH